MSKKGRDYDKGRISGPFVPMLTDTMASKAWRAMSPYARVLYIALKSRYSIKARNNGHIYLSVRFAAQETGFNIKTVARAFRELQHYGFIVLMTAGCLGVEGRGKAPHWRLTELGYMIDLPTRDFMQWDGVIFHEQRAPPTTVAKTESRTLGRNRAYRRTEHTTAPADGTLNLKTVPRNGTYSRLRLYRWRVHI